MNYPWSCIHTCNHLPLGPTQSPRRPMAWRMEQSGGLPQVIGDSHSRGSHSRGSPPPPGKRLPLPPRHVGPATGGHQVRHYAGGKDSPEGNQCVTPPALPTPAAPSTLAGAAPSRRGQHLPLALTMTDPCQGQWPRDRHPSTLMGRQEPGAVAVACECQLGQLGRDQGLLSEKHATLYPHLSSPGSLRFTD